LTFSNTLLSGKASLCFPDSANKFCTVQKNSRWLASLVWPNEIYINLLKIHQELVVHTHTHTEKHTKNKLK